MEEHLKRRIKHAQRRIKELKELHGDKPTEKFNYYGGHSLGYWEGLAVAYEHVLEAIT